MSQCHSKKISTALAALFLFGVAAFVVASTKNSAVFSDSDQDGLSDEEEIAYGTDSQNRDTDGDGYSDGTEVKSGYDPTKPAPGDKIIPEETTEQSDANLSDDYSLSKKFRADTQRFLSSHEDQTITQDDLRAFVEESLAKDLSAGNITKNDLPEIDASDINIVKQDYSDMSDSEKLKRRNEDWNNYLATLSYDFTRSVTGSESITEEDFEKILSEISNKYASLTAGNADYDYFRNLAPKMENFLETGKKMDVPEEVLDMHVTFLRIVQAYLDLRDPSLPKIESDPLAKIIIYSRVRGLYVILSDLAQYNFSEYNNQFSSIN